MAKVLYFEKKIIKTQFIFNIPNFIFKGDFINIFDITYINFGKGKVLVKKPDHSFVDN